MLKYVDTSKNLSPYRHLCSPVSLISTSSSANIPVSVRFLSECDIARHFEKTFIPSSTPLTMLVAIFARSYGSYGLRCLNPVCARSTICTADVNKCAYKTEQNKHGACTAIISFCSVKIVQVFFFRLNYQTVFVSKTFVFQCVKGNTVGKYPAFLAMFARIEKDRESCQMQRVRS